MTTDGKWWLYSGASPIHIDGEYDSSICEDALFMMAAIEGKTFHPNHYRGLAPAGFDAKRDVEDVLLGRGFRQLVRLSDRSALWSRNDSFVQFAQHSRLHLSVYTIDEEIYRWGAEIGGKFTQPARVETGGLVHALVPASGGPQIQRIGQIHSILQRQNYMPSALTAYDHAVADLGSDTPRGRVVVLDGPPGTGKSFMLRAMMTESHRCNFVLVPPKLVEELGQPQYIPALLRAKSDDNPLVLILEDADAVLAPRKAENMSGVSSLLNLGDGILGDIANIRMVATTNSPIKDLDPAIMRPGRLSVRIEVEELDYSRAREVLFRLWDETPRERRSGTAADTALLGSRSQTLARVYEIAAAFGWKPPPRTQADVEDE